MQVTKNFMHPVHMVRYFNALMKRSLATYYPKPIERNHVPELARSISYYFTFATQVRDDLNQMLYALCCFSYDGEIIFSAHGAFDVSLWKYRRLGLAKTAEKIERTIRVVFKRNNVPLNPNEPFQKVEDDLYWANIDWSIYKHLTN